MVQSDPDIFFKITLQTVVSDEDWMGGFWGSGDTWRITWTNDIGAICAIESMDGDKKSVERYADQKLSRLYAKYYRYQDQHNEQ